MIQFIELHNERSIIAKMFARAMKAASYQYPCNPKVKSRWHLDKHFISFVSFLCARTLKQWHHSQVVVDISPSVILETRHEKVDIGCDLSGAGGHIVPGVKNRNICSLFLQHGVFTTTTPHTCPACPRTKVFKPKNHSWTDCCEQLYWTSWTTVMKSRTVAMTSLAVVLTS